MATEQFMDSLLEYSIFLKILELWAKGMGSGRI